MISFANKFYPPQPSSQTEEPPMSSSSFQSRGSSLVGTDADSDDERTRLLPKQTDDRTICNKYAAIGRSCALWQFGALLGE